MDERRINERRREAVDREKLQKRRAGRRRTRSIATFVFLVALLAIAIAVFLRTPLFNVESVEIKGNALVTNEQILAVSGITEGSNIFDHKKSAVEEKLLALPYVSEVKLIKKYPSGIIIQIREEKEFAALFLPGEIIACDKNGKSIKLISEEEAGELISFKNLKKGEFLVGGYAELSTPESTELFKKCLKIINEYEIKGIIEVNIEDKNNIEMILSSDLTIKLGALGSEDDISYKMSYLNEALSRIPYGEGGTLDISNPEVGAIHNPNKGGHKAEEITSAEDVGEEEAPEEVTEETEEEVEAEVTVEETAEEI